MASIESGGSPDTIGVNTEPFIPAMAEELNSTDNSITHDPDGQRALPDPPEVDHRTQHTTANGSNIPELEVTLLKVLKTRWMI